MIKGIQVVSKASVSRRTRTRTGGRTRTGRGK
jgi:hypothetical protein